MWASSPIGRAGPSCCCGGTTCPGTPPWIPASESARDFSYASQIPALEARRNGKAARLLNLLVLEASFPVAGPGGARILLRLYHRSGAWGTLHGVYAGSNFVAVGVEAPF